MPEAGGRRVGRVQILQVSRRGESSGVWAWFCECAGGCKDVSKTLVSRKVTPEAERKGL